MIALALQRVRAHPTIAGIADRLMPAEPVWPSPTLDPERGVVRNAAVAVILRLGVAGALEVLFVARAEYAGDPWSAHVAFPGGRAEPADVSPVETAVRETDEEIGLDLRATGAILGVLPAVAPQAVRLPAVRVRPVVGIVVDPPAFVLGPEVRAAFWVPLGALATDERWRPTRVGVGGRGTILSVSAFTDGEYVIWGLTARIVRSLVVLVPVGTLF